MKQSQQGSAARHGDTAGADERRTSTPEREEAAAPLTAPKPAGPRTYPARPTAAPRAIAIYCVDPRFHEATEAFFEAELGLKKHEFIPLEIPGGAVALSLTELPKDAKYVRDQVAFGLEHFPTVERVIFVSHEDCGKYKALSKAMPHLLGFVKSMLERQHLDLNRGAELLMQFMPRRVEVQKYHAKFANSERTQVIFEKL
jgi:hypothetical protein